MHSPTWAPAHKIVIREILVVALNTVIYMKVNAFLMIVYEMLTRIVKSVSQKHIYVKQCVAYIHGCINIHSSSCQQFRYCRNSRAALKRRVFVRVDASV